MPEPGCASAEKFQTLKGSISESTATLQKPRLIFGERILPVISSMRKWIQCLQLLTRMIDRKSYVHAIRAVRNKVWQYDAARPGKVEGFQCDLQRGGDVHPPRRIVFINPNFARRTLFSDKFALASHRAASGFSVPPERAYLLQVPPCRSRMHSSSGQARVSRGKSVNAPRRAQLIGRS